MMDGTGPYWSWNRQPADEPFRAWQGTFGSFFQRIEVNAFTPTPLVIPSVTTALRLNSNLDGISTSGSFFADPLG